MKDEGKGNGPLDEGALDALGIDDGIERRAHLALGADFIADVEPCMRCPEHSPS